MHLVEGRCREEEVLSGEQDVVVGRTSRGDLDLDLLGEGDLTGEWFRSKGWKLGKDSKLNSATRNRGLNVSKIRDQTNQLYIRNF